MRYSSGPSARKDSDTADSGPFTGIRYTDNENRTAGQDQEHTIFFHGKSLRTRAKEDGSRRFRVLMCSCPEIHSRTVHKKRIVVPCAGEIVERRYGMFIRYNDQSGTVITDNADDKAAFPAPNGFSGVDERAGVKRSMVRLRVFPVCMSGIPQNVLLIPATASTAGAPGRKRNAHSGIPIRESLIQ